MNTDFLLHFGMTADSQLGADSRQQTADSRQQRAESRQQTADLESREKTDLAEVHLRVHAHEFLQCIVLRLLVTGR
jgi:hypothetical protein